MLSCLNCHDYGTPPDAMLWVLLVITGGYTRSGYHSVWNSWDMLVRTRHCRGSAARSSILTVLRATVLSVYFVAGRNSTASCCAGYTVELTAAAL